MSKPEHSPAATQPALRWVSTPGIAGLIFDCDGTLADTMPVHYRAWTLMLDDYGIPFPETRFYAMGGMPTAQIILRLAKDAGVRVVDLDRMVARKEELFLQQLDSVRPIAPVVAIAAAYRNQLPMAVASGGYRNVVERTLQQLSLRDWFATVVAAEDTTRHKPEPDVFLEAARRLGLPPAACAVFEDTDLGLVAAQRAGMLGIDIRPWTAG